MSRLTRYAVRLAATGETIGTVEAESQAEALGRAVVLASATPGLEPGPLEVLPVARAARAGLQ